MRRIIGSRIRGLVLASLLLAIAGGHVAQGQEFIFNGDFEEDLDLWVAWPGYVGGTDPNNPDLINPPEVTEWFGTGIGINPVQPVDGAPANPASIMGYTGLGGHGINPVVPNGEGDAPFRDNGDNDTTVAFLQRTASLQQRVSGLTVGESYLLSLDYNARNCCGDFPMPELSLNGAVVPDFPDPQDSPDGVVLPVGEFNPWYFSEIPFTADSTSVMINISTQSELDLDSTFLIDNLEVVASGGGANLVTNGDFEADAETFVKWPGYVEAGDAALAPFRDNGNNKTAVAFMQGAASLEQDISGLTVGEEYVFSFDYNSRNCCGDIPIAEVTLNDDLLDDFEGLDGVEPVGGENEWYHYETTVTADSSTITLRIATFASDGGDASFLVDNVSFRSPSTSIPGDFNQNGVLDAPDIDDLTVQSAGGANNLTYDLNSDSLVNSDDVTVWIKDLFVSWVGDANLDGQFNSSDLVSVLASGTYEQDIDAVWSSGDFNGDGRTNTSDLVAALSDGGYEVGPRAAVRAVPEPSTALLTCLAFGLLVTRRHARRR